MFDIPPLTGIEGIDIYNRQGAILDAYISGKIQTWDEAMAWAKETKAVEVIERLEGAYHPSWTERGPNGWIIFKPLADG